MFVFFFKQKTAYEMRISDWSSDVCSSDLKLDHIASHKRAQVVGSMVVAIDILIELPALLESMIRRRRLEIMRQTHVVFVYGADYVFLQRPRGWYIHNKAWRIPDPTRTTGAWKKIKPLGIKIGRAHV